MVTFVEEKVKDLLSKKSVADEHGERTQSDQCHLLAGRAQRATNATIWLQATYKNDTSPNVMTLKSVGQKSMNNRPVCKTILYVPLMR